MGYPSESMCELGMYRIFGSGLLDIWPFLLSVSGSSSGGRLPGTEPDKLFNIYILL